MLLSTRYDNLLLTRQEMPFFCRTSQNWLMFIMYVIQHNPRTPWRIRFLNQWLIVHTLLSTRTNIRVVRDRLSQLKIVNVECRPKDLTS